MARVRNAVPTLESVVFSTPEQKVLRLLLSEPTTSFSPRTMVSRLKGVRGLGGVPGLTKILAMLQQAGTIDFLDNHRAVRLKDDSTAVRALKKFVALCDLDGLRQQLEPISSKGILFGSRSTGEARTDSNYNLFVVSEVPEEARKIASRHPMGKMIELVVWTPEAYHAIEKEDPALARKLDRGILVWGASW